MQLSGGEGSRWVEIKRDCQKCRNWYLLSKQVKGEVWGVRRHQEFRGVGIKRDCRARMFEAKRTIETGSVFSKIDDIWSLTFRE